MANDIGKRILRSGFGAALASTTIATYIRLVEASSRRDFIGRENVASLLRSPAGFILAFWHCRLLMGPSVRGETDKQVFMLNSAHRDGAIAANAIKGFGIQSIRGSAADPKKPHKDKSGAPAIAAMINALEVGAIVGLTPDGPRGPAEVAKIGIIKLAALSGAPIVPAAYSASRGPRLDTWDRFLLAAPFSKICFVTRPALIVDKGADAQALETSRIALERELTAAAQIADEKVGRQR